MPRYRYKNEREPETLTEFLESYSVPMLKNLAKLIASKLPNRKAEVVEVIRRKLEDGATLRTLWEDLDVLQRAAVSEAVYSPTSSLDSFAFQAKYGKVPDTRLSEYRRTTPSLLCLFLYRGGHMPSDLKPRLKTFVPKPEPVEMRVEERRPETVTLSWFGYNYETGKRERKTEVAELVYRQTEQEAQHDLQAILRLVDAGKIRVSAKTRRVTAAGARAIVEVLQGGDFYPSEAPPDKFATDPNPIKAFAWPLILQSANLAGISGGKLQLTPAGRKALTAAPHQIIKKAWDRWLKTTILDEFNQVSAIKGQTGKGKRGMTAVAKRRQVVVDGLTACPPGKWVAFDELSRFMRATGLTFWVTMNPWHLYISSPFYGILQSEDWHVFQERYMMAFLFEYAATLGLIDVGYIHPSGARRDYHDLWGTDDLDCLSRYDGLVYLRVNNLGAWCLGCKPQYDPSPMETEPVLKVLPNLDVVATASLMPADRLALAQFAKQTADAVWKLDSELLLRSLEAGHSIADMEAFLEAKCDGELPGTVRVFFKDLIERTSRLTDRGRARLIEAADVETALLIANDSRTRSLCMLTGERFLAVMEDSETAFRAALRKMGYVLPK